MLISSSSCPGSHGSQGTPVGPVSPWLQSDLQDFLLPPCLLSIHPELAVLRSADHQVLDGQPQAMVEMNRDCDQAVADEEGHGRVQHAGEPLDHHEDDVLNDDEQWPDVENPERLRESQEISPIFTTKTSENISKE